MRLKHTLPLFLLVLIFSCNSKTVTHKDDYKTYMTTTVNTPKMMANVTLWSNKLKATPTQFPYYGKRASAYSKLFNTTGDISYLINAENDLLTALKMSGGNNSSYLKRLASNYISQHRFKEALSLLKQAEANGDKLNGTKKMLFDVYLELGNFIYAEAYLKDIKNTSDFDYLIRLAKWEDHKGNLDAAIINMEKATAIAESSNMKGTKQWAYTNLADFYGHSGAIEKSYAYFLKALALDPNDAYAKKGIAWIIYSYEKNPEEALNILNHVTSYYYAPDYDLLKADISEFKKDEVAKSEFIMAYRKSVQNKQYGVMYNAYNVMVYAEDLLLTERAIEISEEEIKNRPTPHSYELLAWSYFKNGAVDKAVEIVDKHVNGQTFEPTALYHTAEIYKAAERTDAVMPLKEELIGSLYELGPNMITKINQL